VGTTDEGLRLTAAIARLDNHVYTFLYPDDGEWHEQDARLPVDAIVWGHRWLEGMVMALRRQSTVSTCPMAQLPADFPVWWRPKKL
jgi:hypothetical protein